MNFSSLTELFLYSIRDKYLVTDAMFTETMDARRVYNPGDISPNTGLEKQDDGTWAPPKKDKSTDKEIQHGDVFKNKNGDVARIRDEGA